MTQDNPLNQKNDVQVDAIKELRTIFSEEEIRGTVKAFALGILRGTIKIQFDNVDQIIEREKREGQTMDYKIALREEVRRKKAFVKSIEIVSGAEKSTEEQLENAIKAIFSDILALRAGNRIKGKFLEFDLEKKMDELEIKLDATNNVVEELVKWLTDEATGSNKLL